MAGLLEAFVAGLCEVESVAGWFRVHERLTSGTSIQSPDELEKDSALVGCRHM